MLLNFLIFFVHSNLFVHFRRHLIYSPARLRIAPEQTTISAIDTIIIIYR